MTDEKQDHRRDVYLEAIAASLFSCDATNLMERRCRTASGSVGDCTRGIVISIFARPTRQTAGQRTAPT
jgi:hypothetical protein